MQIKLSDEECQKTLGKSCIFRDKLFQDPYLHETTLNIFSNKVFASQLSNDKTITLQVKDGSYLLATNNDNMISFNTKDGEITDLELQDGNLIKENNNLSKCEKAQILYNFYNLYKKPNAIVTKSGLYKDEYNFSGIKEYLIFAEKDRPSDLMAVVKEPDEEISKIENLQLCRIVNSDILRVKYSSDEECDNKESAECFKYQDCRNEVIVSNCEINLFQGFDNKE